MHTFRKAGDNIHLYFSNTEHKSDRMLLADIIQLVMEQGIEIKDKIQTSDCELYKFHDKVNQSLTKRLKHSIFAKAYIKKRSIVNIVAKL